MLWIEPRDVSDRQKHNAASATNTLQNVVGAPTAHAKTEGISEPIHVANTAVGLRSLQRQEIGKETEASETIQVLLLRNGLLLASSMYL